jgi:hypothetical protein
MREPTVSLILLPGANPVLKQATKIMADQSLLDYVKQQLENKIPEETIRKALLDAGWQNTLVEEAFNLVKPPIIPAPAPLTGVFATDQKPAVQAEQAKPAELENQPKTDLGAGIRGLQPQTGTVQSVPTENKLKADQAVESQDQPQFQPLAQPGSIQAERIPSENIQSQKAVKPGIQVSEQGLEIGGNQKEVKKEIPARENTTIPEKKESVSQAETPGGLGDSLGKVSALDIQFGKTFGLPAVPDKNELMPSVASPKPVLEEMTAVREKAGISELEAGMKTEAGQGKEEKIDPEADGSGRKTKRKTIFFALIGLLIILLIGASGAAYYFFVMTPSATSETIFKQAADNMAKVKTAEFTGAVVMEPESSVNGAQTYSVDFEGVADFSDAQNKKAFAKFYLKGFSGAGQDNPVSFSIDIIGAGNAYYIKRSNISVMAGFDFGSYTDQWLKIDPDNFQQELAVVMPDLNQNDKASAVKELTFGQMAMVLSILGLNTQEFSDISGIDKLADEEVSGVPCWHFKQNGNPDSKELNLGGGEIWIGKKDNLWHKYALQSKPFTMTQFFRNFDQPASIAAPESFRAIEEISKELAAVKVVETETEIPAVSADTRRMNDMASLFSDQKSWFLANKRFYTCGTNAGDCGGMPNSFPTSLGALRDPAENGFVCGQDFTYCGIDNSKYPKSFCYYGKLDDGSFITSSAYGNFKRTTIPKTFKECQTGIEVKSIDPNNESAATRDAKRQLDMHRMANAQEMFYVDNGKNLTSATMPATIGVNLVVPSDPGGGVVVACDQPEPAFVYCTLDNTGEDQKYCYFAKLESGGYYTSSPSGSFKRSTKPTNFSECENGN